MEHTITANGIQQGHIRGLVLNQLHIGLAVGFTIVACLTAFGGGVIVGMWYKASEQSAPLGAAVTASTPETPLQSRDAASQPQEPVTFYNTLTNSNVAYAPLTPPATPAPSGAAGSGKGAAASVSSGATSARETTSGAVEGTKAAAASHTARAIPAGGMTRTASVSEPQKNAPAVSTPKTAPVAALRPTGSTKPVTAAATAAQKSVGPERQPGRETGAQHRASGPAVATAKAASAEDFSVQVGSFGSAEQAEQLRTNLAQKGYPVRVQPSAVPGQGLRYRVRVGNFADRTAADQTAHHLTAQEQVPAIVAGKD